MNSLHMMKDGSLATMAVHDSATGTIKRHIIRKVQLGTHYRLPVLMGTVCIM